MLRLVFDLIGLAALVIRYKKRWVCVCSSGQYNSQGICRLAGEISFSHSNLDILFILICEKTLMLRCWFWVFLPVGSILIISARSKSFYPHLSFFFLWNMFGEINMSSAILAEKYIPYNIEAISNKSNLSHFITFVPFLKKG
jgi:hypothetical protein